MSNFNTSVDEIVSDIIDSKRHMIVEDAVDEYLLAEIDILTEATTAADKMVDMSLDDDEDQYLEDDEEVNEFIDASIDDISLEEDEFQDTLDEYGLEDEEDVIEDIGDIIDEELPYDDLDSMIDDGADIDALI